MSRLIVIVLCLVVVMIATAQDEDGIALEIAEDPTILHGDDGRFTDPGAVIAHDGRFHMLRNRFAEFPGAVEIYYHTSEDGIEWEQVGTEPIISPDDVPYDVIGAYASSVHIEEDDTWVLYLYTYPDEETGLGQGGSIVRATADFPDAEWRFEPEPVLTPGDTDDWDGFRVTAPSVVKRDDGYIMLYEGIADDFGDRFIGLATSDDGLTWEKHGEPVLTPELNWERDHTHQPRVVDTENGLVMLYRTYLGRQTLISLGLATSEDGITWERLTVDAPLLTQGPATNRQPIWYTAIAYQDGLFAIPLELGATRGGTHIHAATFVLP